MTRALHEFTSTKLLLPLTRLQRSIRPSTRPASRASAEGLQFRRSTQTWSEDRKREWTLERLRLAVRSAAAHTSHFRNVFAQCGFDPRADFSFADYARLPVLERDVAMEAGPALLSTALPAGQLRRDTTGGSTGVPMAVWLGPEERGWRESGIRYFMERVNAPPGVRTALFWGHHLDVRTGTSWRERYRDFAEHTKWFDCFRLSSEVLAEYHATFENWQPACIISYASALASLAEYLHERGVRATYPSRCLLTGAEKLLPGQRAVIEAVFDKPVLERYGGRDVGGLAYQLAPGGEFIVDWPLVFLEPETDEEQSSLLVTKLRADGMPMLRYRVGDIGSFPNGSTPGEPTFALREILGRELDKLWLPDGRWIHGAQIPHLMKDYSIREYMVTQQADFSVEVKIVPRSTFNEESRADLRNIIAMNLPGVPVSISIVSSIPRNRANKLRPVITHVPVPSAASQPHSAVDM